MSNNTPVRWCYITHGTILNETLLLCNRARTRFKEAIVLRQHLQVFYLSSKLHRNAVPQLNKCCIKKSSLKVVLYKITFKKHYRLMLSLRLKSTRQQPAKTTKGIAWNRVPGLLSRYILNRLPAIFFGLGGGGGGVITRKVSFFLRYIL